MDTLGMVRQCPLFKGIQDQELDQMLACLNSRQVSFPKGSFIFREGDQISEIGIVLSGVAHILQEDYWGNKSIVSEVQRGQLFGESFACNGTQSLSISVMAEEDCRILFLGVGKVLNVCSSVCQFHTKLIRNLILVLSEKNLLLTRKMSHTSKRSMREKLLSYLSEQAKRKNSPYFEVPFNRQQLADYFSVDRSALSKELGKMRKEGILEYDKNMFRIKKW